MQTSLSNINYGIVMVQMRSCQYSNECFLKFIMHQLFLYVKQQFPNILLAKQNNCNSSYYIHTVKNIEQKLPY